MTMTAYLLSEFLQILLIIILILIAVAYLTLFERKVLAIIQRRKGPNVIGIFGLLQPLADGFKLLMKEPIVPSNSNKLLFILAPMLSFIISLIGWSLIPFSENGYYVDIDLSLLFIISVSSIGVYGIIISGWSSNSKYAFLGALRSSAQIISYELSLTFSVISVCICSNSSNIHVIVLSQTETWYCLPLAGPALVFFIAGLAETNRHPFDLPEAESELVSGYNVEYSAMSFALFSLAEYSNILMMCALNTLLFWGGWLPPFAFLSFIPGAIWFGLKVATFATLFIYIRAILPRFRYDQLMYLGWKVLLPISIGYVFITSLLFYFL
jgi:NADH-quinone oxidoreductase subunit H